MTQVAQRRSRSEGTNPELRKRLGSRLRDGRQAAGYTQERVAELLNISPNIVWRWEDGRVAPMLDRLDHLADIYGVSVDWLLGRDSPRDEDMALATDLVRFMRERKRLYRTGPDDRES